MKKKDICLSLATVVLFLYKLFILPKIPFKLTLKKVEMPQNVEYPTFPLNKEC